MARKLVEREGVPGFFYGCTAKTLQNAMQKFEFFYIYNWVSRAVKGMVESKTLGVRANLFVGYVSAVATVFFTNPLEVAANRMQTGASHGGLVSTLKEMYREGGLGVMFRGFATNMLLCINPAIEFTLFDQLKNIALDRLRQQGIKRPHLTTWQVFWIGALAKACATITTYPGVYYFEFISTFSILSHYHPNVRDRFSTLDVQIKTGYGTSQGVSRAEFRKSCVAKFQIAGSRDSFANQRVGKLRATFYRKLQCVRARSGMWAKRVGCRKMRRCKGMSDGKNRFDRFARAGGSDK